MAPVVLKGHQAAVWCLIELSNGTYATASADKTIKLWRKDSGVLNTLKGTSFFFHFSYRKQIKTILPSYLTMLLIILIGLSVNNLMKCSDIDAICYFQ